MNSWFFEETYEPQIIENISFNDLELRLNVIARHLPLDSLPNRWAYFAYLKGLEKGLTHMYSINFGYMISSFMAGLGVDAGTDIYFKLGIDEQIFDIYEESRSIAKQSGWTEKELAIEFFHAVLLFYMSPHGAMKYEKAIFQHNIRVGSTTKKWFLSRNQSSKKTIVELMRGKTKSPEIRDKGTDENLTFKFTYSEEEMWNDIEGEDDSSKLASLVE